MTKNKKLTPVEQKQVAFYDDELTAVRADDGHVYVGISQMCQALGIDAQAQRRRIERHIVLTDGLKGVAKLATPGGIQSGYVLRVDLVPLWLSGIRVSAVNEEVRPKLERFQREAATVLWEAFQDGRLTTSDEDFDLLLKQASGDAVEAYQIALAVVKLARNQIRLEARIDEHETRLETIEANLQQPDRYITEEQATQISQAVRAIGLTISQKTGKNEYGRVWGEFYRRFGVSKYRHLPIPKFDEAMAFLTEWHQNLTGDEPF